MAAKTSLHIYGTKLSHCHPVHTAVLPTRYTDTVSRSRLTTALCPYARSVGVTIASDRLHGLTAAASADQITYLLLRNSPR